LGLPDISEQEIYQKIIQVAPSLPIIVLSAKTDVVEKAAPLEMGDNNVAGQFRAMLLHDSPRQTNNILFTFLWQLASAGSLCLSVGDWFCLGRKTKMFAMRDSGVSMMLAVLWLCASGSQSAAQTYTITYSGTTFTTLHSFDGTDGNKSFAGLIQATNGNLYGTTYYGGARNSGEVFEITPGGTLTTLYSLCSKSGCTDGEYTYATPVQGTDGNFYGTTYLGGSKGDGEIFKITPSGTLNALHSFCSRTSCKDGRNPFAGLVQAVDGNLYGTTLTGGAKGYGTVFKVTPSGAFTTLHSLCSQSGCPDGEFPQTGLVQATNGNLYGVMGIGGANNGGTIFRMTLSGTLTTLHSFCSQPACADGQYPAGGWSRTPTGICTGQRQMAGPTAMARSSACL
jgi:uncharacterized repeat protein (TIGR03803 family)